MLEADLSEGDLSQVTQAIQNALRPHHVPTRLIQAPISKDPVLDNEQMASDEFEDVDAEAIEAAKPRVSRSSKPRVAKTPTVLNDIDTSSAPTLKDFVSDFDITTNVDKYLVIALWFRDTRDVPAITVDHVYTCFKLLGWSAATNDFSKPLKNLRDEQSLRGGPRDGGYSLTLTGAGKIEAKKRAA